MSAKLPAPKQPRLRLGIEGACARIAPTWPLDQFIAVNPYWGHLDRTMQEASARLSTLSGTRLTMPREYYLERWHAGDLDAAALEAAINERDLPLSAASLISALDATSPARAPLKLVTDASDDARDLRHVMPWRDFVTHQISQHCAAFFDQHQATWHPNRADGLYASWLRQASTERSTAILMGRKGLNAFAARLPAESSMAIEHCIAALGMPDDMVEPYVSALLLSANGWASWCAYARWQSALDGSAGAADQLMVDLLAIRLVWEAFLFATDLAPASRQEWIALWSEYPARLERERSAQSTDWIFQRGLELAYTSRLCSELAQSAPPSTAAPEVQAVFCIDVRSEVMRRALEAEDPGVQTLGFAGFFGLPISYSPIGTAMTRPQLPGLLSPSLRTADEPSSPSLGKSIRARRALALQQWQRWKDFRTSASSAFTFVEACGLGYAVKLLRQSLPREGSQETAEQIGLSDAEIKGLAPALQPPSAAVAEGSSDAVELQFDLLAGVVRAMSLPRPHARLILLAGHGSQSANNPHAAGLDCGACGGQTGEVNARVLANLLNANETRRGLAVRGISLADTTHFVAGLHNTTTDEITLYELDRVPATHRRDLARLQDVLKRAGARARCERAPGLDGIGLEGRNFSPHRKIYQRANDWAQVRPEWGLADNAAFIVAPRSRTQHIDLAGRAFLHDYRWQDDADGSVLELIMTAPMVVTNWINLQYYASTVDNRRYGSGNKVLHNVVGGRIGVFEGNGGDLRIGLPWQSLHDGHRLRHTPLRLSVFIEAPAEAIQRVVSKHAVVAHLIDHEWLHLHRVAPDGVSYRLHRGRWNLASPKNSLPAKDKAESTELDVLAR